MIAYAISVAIALSPIGEAILRLTEGCRRLKTREEIETLLPLFEEVYQDAKEKYPGLNNNVQLFLTDKMYVNAFAIGQRTVAITKGTVETFSQDELKGVIAHELGHISHGDTKALLLNVVGNGLFTILIMFVRLLMATLHALSESIEAMAALSIIFSVLRFIFDVALLLFLLLGQIILSMNSRYGEYLADEFASRAGFGDELISALYILQKTSLPGGLTLLERLRASHPHLADRIARLERLQGAEQYAG